MASACGFRWSCSEQSLLGWRLLSQDIEANPNITGNDLSQARPYTHEQYQWPAGRRAEPIEKWWHP